MSSTKITTEFFSESASNLRIDENQRGLPFLYELLNAAVMLNVTVSSQNDEPSDDNEASLALTDSMPPSEPGLLPRSDKGQIGPVDPAKRRALVSNLHSQISNISS